MKGGMQCADISQIRLKDGNALFFFNKIQLCPKALAAMPRHASSLTWAT